MEKREITVKDFVSDLKLSAININITDSFLKKFKEEHNDNLDEIKKYMMQEIMEEPLSLQAIDLFSFVISNGKKKQLQYLLSIMDSSINQEKIKLLILITDYSNGYGTPLSFFTKLSNCYLN